ncbi:ATP-binding protein [Streptomyces sp. BG9H]|uniref:ATP-binding protein n=1 Tax=Streptomyces anatolicus TaxID=2675858 RepID=A0ABS6YVX3_9ACTN|nr:ATP-binding protein [Streptomyces anatolicus]MBW5425588.1 ATP-binding protein [Streptomyces anatolicus]
MKPQIPTPTGELTAFRQLLSPTPRGARLARRLTVHQVDAWGFPQGSDASEAAAHIVAEFAANAVTHGRVSGRDFELRLLRREPDTLRIEVADARGDLLPRSQPDGAEAESGRGLWLVEAFATAWGVTEREVGKTVWAELTV